jgi:hypothetical protein
MSSVELGKLEQVNPRNLWLSESAHFTPWLTTNLATLGDALGLELELIRAESSVGPFACDIEAREISTGRKVIIENQLEQTDHGHLGQLLTYAAGLDATIIVWISPLVREEHRQAIDFLNRHTAEGLDFFAVSLEVVKIGSSLPAVVFRLVASPNAWAKTVATMTRSAPPSSRMLAYQEFFQGVIDELRTVHHFTNARIGQPLSWYSFSSGTKGLLYSASFTAQAQLRASKRSASVTHLGTSFRHNNCRCRSSRPSNSEMGCRPSLAPEEGLRPPSKKRCGNCVGHGSDNGCVSGIFRIPSAL